MKLVIDIPSGAYESIKFGKFNKVLTNKAWESVRNATPLTDCTDAISREEVSSYVESHIQEINSGYGDMNSHTNRILRMIVDYINSLPSVNPTRPKAKWISVDERLPETDNENNVNRYDVLLWVKNKNHPEREPQAYIGKLMKVKGSDGSDNFWGIKTKDCEWTIWGWSYFNEPEVLAWMPLPEPYNAEMERE